MATRSLGRLTLDMVLQTGNFLGPMDKASRQTRRNMDDMRRQARRMGVAVVGAFTAVTGAMVVMVNQSRQTIDENAKLAAALGGTVLGVEGLARAAGRAGVSTGELRQAATRLNQALGEAIQHGGPAADALERLGLNAETLSRMDVDERFAALANRIGEMGLSTQLAGAELRKLGIRQASVITLMQQGGEAIEQSRVRLEKYGVALSDIDAAKVEQMNDALDDLSIISTGFARQLTVQLAPVVEAVSNLLAEASIEAGGMGNVVESVFDKTVSGAALVMNAVDGLVRAFQVAGRGIAIFGLGAQKVMLTIGDVIINGPTAAVNGLIDQMNRLPAVDIGPVGQSALGDSISAELDLVTRAIEIGMEDIDDILMKPLAGSAFKQLIDDAKEASEASAAASVAARRAAGQSFSAIEESSKEAAKAQKTLQDQFAQTAASYERQIALFDATTEAQNLAYEIQHGRLVGINAEQQRRVELLAAELDALAEAKRLAEEQQRINDDARSVAEGLRTEEEAILASYERRRKIVLDNTAITGEARAELLRRLEEQTNEELLEATGGYWERWLMEAEESFADFDQLTADVAENFSSRFGDAFESVVFDTQSLDDAFFTMAEGMARSIINALGQMAGQWLAYQAVQALVGRTTQASAAATTAANAQAGVFLAGVNAFASTAAIPYVGPVMAPAAMAAAIAATQPLAAAASASALAGMAHDGIDRIPLEGTWLLDQGERVLSRPQADRLDQFLARQEGSGSGGRGGSSTVNQSIYLQGRLDNRTANQLASDSARKQRMVSARLGS